MAGQEWLVKVIAGKDARRTWIQETVTDKTHRSKNLSSVDQLNRATIKSDLEKSREES